MTTVASEGNKRIGNITNEEVEQSILDITAWFKRKNANIDYSGASQAEIERFIKVLDVKIPTSLTQLLKEVNGHIWFLDKKLLSIKEIIAMNDTLSSSSNKWKNTYISLAGDESNLLVMNTANQKLYEWDVDEGMSDEEISENLGMYLESYRNLLLNGHCEYDEDIGVIETVVNSTKGRK